jgi:geranylgeranyl reductase family protein
MEGQYDVVIVGGGPGGATAGMLLAQHNLSVVILEKARFPRDKPCGGLLSGRAVRIVSSLHGEAALAQLARASSTGCRLLHQRTVLAEAIGCDTLFVVARRELDGFLLQAAREAGCTVFEHSEVRDVQPARSAVMLSSGEMIRGGVIIGADGANSTVRKTCWPQSQRAQKAVGLGLVADVAAAQLQTAEMRDACSRLPHVFFGLTPWGYGWIFPKGETLSVGVGGLLGQRVALRTALQWLVSEHFREGVWESLRIYGHPLPVGNFQRTAGRGNILLVGDAAGLVEPVTGEGIAFALQSAQLAATSALAALSRGKPSQAGRHYNAWLRRCMLRHFRHASVARWLLFSKPCFPAAMRALRRHPKLLRYYLELLSGKMSYLGFFRRMLGDALG